MQAKTMEGLIGARNNINIAHVPVRIYKDAERRGDLATMERAAGYAGEFTLRAEEYKSKADEGMAEEAKEAKKEESWFAGHLCFRFLSSLLWYEKVLF